ncbi:MAG: hypothetical protein ACTSWX_16365 [Promethearchaeota archaeon]
MGGKIRTRINKTLKKEKLELTSSKFERELIKTLNHYVKTSVLAEIHALDDSTQLQNAVNIGEKFQEICDSIGNDPEFKKMFNFLSFVRMKDREIARLIKSMKLKYDFGNPDKFRVEHEISADNLEFILQSLKSQLKSLQQEEEEKNLARLQEKEEKEKNKLEHKRERQNFIKNDLSSYTKIIRNNKIVKKTELWTKDKLHPEEMEENKEKIKKFRKNLTEEKKKQIEKELTSREENSILSKWIKKLNKKLLKFESFGNYQHIMEYTDSFFKFSEKLDEKFRKNPEFHGKTQKLRGNLRNYYKFLEDWVNRVNIKYEDPKKRNQKEEKVEPKEIDDFLKEYESNRTKYIIFKENRRILNILNSKDKEIVKQKKKQEFKEKIEKVKSIKIKKRNEKESELKYQNKKLPEKEKNEGIKDNKKE